MSTVTEPTNRWKWIATIVALLVGAVFVYTGVMTGEQWAAFVGGLLTGGGGKAAYDLRKT
ncbi:MAG: hypothetical protein M3Q39_01640 [Actinomycetota bacterium]|nr:hypothetical protein [Actinomycetota bacterium]